jgi:hypothetical protein
MPTKRTPLTPRARELARRRRAENALAHEADVNNGADNVRLRNDPESSIFTVEENTTLETGRLAIVEFKRTFARWVDIGRGIVVIRAKADQAPDGHRNKAFKALLDQQGYGLIDNSTASHLQTIIARLPEIEAWRATLTEKERYDWASPTAIRQHWPLFKKTKSAVEVESKAVEADPVEAYPVEADTALPLPSESELVESVDGAGAPGTAMTLADDVDQVAAASLRRANNALRTLKQLLPDLEGERRQVYAASLRDLASLITMGMEAPVSADEPERMPDAAVITIDALVTLISTVLAREPSLASRQLAIDAVHKAITPYGSEPIALMKPIEPTEITPPRQKGRSVSDEALRKEAVAHAAKVVGSSKSGGRGDKADKGGKGGKRRQAAAAE